MEFLENFQYCEATEGFQYTDLICSGLEVEALAKAMEEVKEV